ncbi:hypothetical protein RUM43_009437 [Polyplax serrata]|uniref:Uncharacterized protein n=1 Tax=Polyplax serrata TaxID=468196 RepID=A0AAN8S4I9_POLSC
MGDKNTKGKIKKNWACIELRIIRKNEQTDDGPEDSPRFRHDDVTEFQRVRGKSHERNVREKGESSESWQRRRRNVSVAFGPGEKQKGSSTRGVIMEKDRSRRHKENPTGQKRRELKRKDTPT